MAIDQRDVSSTLRFMDDRALQQYAAMHKNDPYIFPLAFQESQNRQRLRMGQQMQMAQQPQPKVADQALAQMAPQTLPEEQGIGALPAGNMQGMADGGIAGYEGYDEGQSDFGQGPVMMMAGGGVARFAGEGPSLVHGSVFDQLDQQKASQIAQLNSQLAIIEPQLRAAAASGDQQAIQLYAQQAQAIRNEINTAREAAGNRVGVIDKLATSAPTAAETPQAPTANRAALNQAEQAARKNPAVYGTTAPAAPKADTGRKAPPAATTEPSAKTDTGGLDSLIKNFTRDTELAQGALRKQRVGLASQLETEATGEAEAVKKRIKEEGDVFAGKEARLAEREKGIEGMGDKYMGLALLQAGAAMMSTPGNIGTVLGKGIQVGSERYIAGIDKINAAKDKFAEARDRLEDLRLNRDDMNKKEIRDADRAVRTARIQGQQLLVDGATNDLKMTTDNMREFFKAGAENLQTDKRITSAEKIAGMQERGANARAMTPDKLVFDQLTKQYGGDTVKAAEALQKMKTEKFNVYDAYSKYLQAFAGKDTLKGPDDFDVFAKRFIPTITPTKNTTVRTQPGG